MAKYGYLFLTKNLSTKDEDLAWMKAFGCDNIIEEEGAQEISAGSIGSAWSVFMTGLTPAVNSFPKPGLTM